MRIELYAQCWNDATMLPFFFTHYDPLVSRYFFYDDGSSDNTVEVLKAHPRVEVRPFVRIDPSSFVLSEQALSDECWKESRGRADWVIVTDIDEHLYHPSMMAYLESCLNEGITVIPALGFQMISDEFPHEGARLCEEYTMGMPCASMMKPSIFNPNELAEIRFSPGRHRAYPLGNVKMPDRDEVLLFHYKFLNFERTCARQRLLLSGLGAGDMSMKMGQHYTWTTEKMWEDWQRTLNAASDTRVNRESLPDHYPIPRWWISNRAELAEGYIRKVFYQFFYAHPKTDCTILDIGPGDGYLMEAVCRVLEVEQVKPRRVTGLEFLESTLARARARLDGHGPFGFALFDGVRLPFEDSSCDLIYSLTAFESLPKDLAYDLLREIRRVLKPGGYALVFFPSFHFNMKRDESWWTWKKEVDYQLQSRADKQRFYYTEEELEAALRHMAGFDHVNIAEDEGYWVCFGPTELSAPLDDRGLARHGFSAADYLALNPDLSELADQSGDPEKFALDHWLNFGFKECRVWKLPALPPDFDAKTYLQLHADVAALANHMRYPEKFAAHHWLRYGMIEQRAWRLP